MENVSDVLGCIDYLTAAHADDGFCLVRDLKSEIRDVVEIDGIHFLMVKDRDACFFAGLKYRITEHGDQAVSEKDGDLGEIGIFQVCADLGGNAFFDLKDRRNVDVILVHLRTSFATDTKSLNLLISGTGTLIVPNPYFAWINGSPAFAVAS